MPGICAIAINFAIVPPEAGRSTFGCQGEAVAAATPQRVACHIAVSELVHRLVCPASECGVCVSWYGVNSPTPGWLGLWPARLCGSAPAGSILQNALLACDTDALQFSCSFVQFVSATVIRPNPFLNSIQLLCAEPTEIQHNKGSVREHRCCIDLTRDFETPAHALVKRLPGPDRERPKVVRRVLESILSKDQRCHTKFVA